MNQKQSNQIGIAALVLGILGFILSCIYIGGILGVIALILGIIGVCRPNKSKGTSITGIVLGALSLIFTFLMVLGIFTIDDDNKSTVSKSSSQEDTAVSSAASTTASETPSVLSNEQVINVGDIISNDNMEITINKVELTYDVQAENDAMFSTHYPADTGTVYIHVDCDVKNLQKQELSSDKVMQVKAIYDDGYEYSGFAVVEDSSLGFSQAWMSSVDPLQSQGIHYLIECPEEVDQSDKPLYVELDLNNTSDNYKMIIR